MKPEEIPILVYHDISDSNSQWCVSPIDFKKQMSILKDEGYTTISLTKLDELLKNQQKIEKSVVITFDDARKGIITQAYPILKKQNFTATIFVVPQWIDKQNIPADEQYSEFLSWSDLKELKDNGFEIGSHTFSHKNLKELGAAEIWQELSSAEEALTKNLNTKPEHFAYPFGEYDEEAIQEVKNRCKTAVTITRGFDRSPFEWSRQAVLRNTTEEHFKKLLRRPTLSLCMIVKNEEKALQHCLDSVKGLVDEIVIVDTGSADNTKQIAKQFTDKINDFQWTNDFATARNESIKHATGDWILILDADETLAQSDHKKIMEAINHWKVDAYQLISRNYTNRTSMTGWQPMAEPDPLKRSPTGWYPSVKVRLFQNKPHIRFVGQMHEMVESTIEANTIKTLQVPIHHYGTLNADAEEKLQRYIDLTRKKIESNPTAKAYFELGIQYKEQGKFDEAEQSLQQSIQLEETSIFPRLNLAIVQQKQNKLDEAIENFNKVIEKESKCADAYFGLGFCYFKKNEAQKAIENFERAIHYNPNLVDAYANLAALYEKSDNPQKALDALKNALNIAPNHAQSYYNLGVIHEKLGNKEIAVKAYQMAIDLNYKRKEELRKKIRRIE
jgi:peptidoglycan/xylan/chitin deacetylase (PgdA/CDA1 family)/Tfp pilus assembly protein PilF